MHGLSLRSVLIRQISGKKQVWEFLANCQLLIAICQLLFARTSRCSRSWARFPRDACVSTTSSNGGCRRIDREGRRRWQFRVLRQKLFRIRCRFRLQSAQVQCCHPRGFGDNRPRITRRRRLDRLARLSGYASSRNRSNGRQGRGPSGSGKMAAHSRRAPGSSIHPSCAG
jgi:hypothetical protein